MTKEIKETIEILKTLHRVHEGGSIAKAISIAISWGEMLEKAGEELGEKKEKTLHTVNETVLDDNVHIKRSIKYFDRYSDEDKGFNQMHDIARPILAKAKLRIKELKSACDIKNASIETSLKMYRNLEKELQSLKKKLTVIVDYQEEPNAANMNEELVWEYKQRLDEIQALIKELE